MDDSGSSGKWSGDFPVLGPTAFIVDNCAPGLQQYIEMDISNWVNEFFFGIKHKAKKSILPVQFISLLMTSFALAHYLLFWTVGNLSTYYVVVGNQFVELPASQGKNKFTGADSML